MTPEEVQFEVDTIMGQTDDESLVWINFKVKKNAREDVIKPAIALIKKHCPESQLVDEDGNVTEMSDGAALEMMAANPSGTRISTPSLKWNFQRLESDEWDARSITTGSRCVSCKKIGVKYQL